MKNIFALLFLALMLIQCEEEVHIEDDVESEEEQLQTTKPSCTTPATVKDLTGLDGCRFIFVLNDGTRLEPIIRNPGPLPHPKEITEDPLYNFQFVDGKKVSINYEAAVGFASICMVGKKVKITCISD